MLDKIEQSIKKFGLFETIKGIGGVDVFINIVKSHPKLKPYLDKIKGICSVSYISDYHSLPDIAKSYVKTYPDAFFDFLILDFEMVDDVFAELTVDMSVDFSNLSDEEINKLKQWLVLVADDFGFEIHGLSDEFPNDVNLFIKSFNGEPYTRSQSEHYIKDTEAFKIIEKTGMWGELNR